MVFLDKKLKRLSQTFSVKDIMISKEKLIIAEDFDEAKKLVKKYPDYEIIPIADKNNNLTGYLERGKDSITRIPNYKLISENTSIMDILAIIQQRKFCFVLVNNDILGFIHFSDLNNPIVKLPFFFLLNDIENILIKKLENKIDIDVIQEKLDPERVEKITEKFSKMKEKRANLDYIHLLFFGELLGFAKHFNIIDLKTEEIEILSNTRNRIIHAGRPLIETVDDIQKIINANSICNSLLKKFECN